MISRGKINRVGMTLAFLVTLFLVAPETMADHRPGHDKGGGHNDGGGGGKGGFGELGDACVYLANPGPSCDSGTVCNDGVPEYCNGEDGQISVPSRFRIDTKKFNGNDSKYWVKAKCGHEWCGSDRRVKAFQSQHWYNQDGTLYNPDNVPGDFNGIELDFQAMGVNQVVRVSMAVAAFDKSYRFLFAKNSSGSFRCQNDQNTGPVWVKCIANSNGDNYCDRWTISTSNLFGGSQPPATACLKENDVEVASGVEANFTIDVCVLGGGDLAPCPDVLLPPP